MNSAKIQIFKFSKVMQQQTQGVVVNYHSFYKSLKNRQC